MRALNLPESLLPCCVPNLEFDKLVDHINDLWAKFDTNRVVWVIFDCRKMKKVFWQVHINVIMNYKCICVFLLCQKRHTYISFLWTGEGDMIFQFLHSQWLGTWTENLKNKTKKSFMQQKFQQSLPVSGKRPWGAANGLINQSEDWGLCVLFI